MARQIQIRRGTAAEHDEFTGAIGEVTMDTTNNTLRVHDGETVGGTILAKRTDLDIFDCIIESQSPTQANNYSWYRKYRSGRVEQGGILKTSTSQVIQVSLLVTMRDICYDYRDVLEHVNTYVDNPWKIRDCPCVLVAKTVSAFSRHVPKEVELIRWFVSGMAAIE